MIHKSSTKKLGEVIRIVGGGTPSTKNDSYWGGGNFWATPRDLAQLKIADINSTARTITEFGLEHSSAELLPVGSVILSTRAPIGYVAITTEPMAINQGCRAFICGEEINNKYLYYFFVISKKYLQSLGRGATFTEINKSTLENIKIPLPSIDIQKQIVERLDKIAEAQKLNDKLIQKTNELFQSLFYNEYEAKHNQWDSKKLQEICKKIDQMHPSKIFKKEFSYIDIASIDDDKVIRAQIVSVDKAPSRARKLVKVGDTIFSTVRPYLKHIAYIPEMLDNSVASTGLCVIRPNTNLINPLFLNYVAESDHFVRKVLPFQRGANYPAVSDRNVYDIKISLPPLKIQKQIVAKLSSVQEYKTQLLAQKSKLKELFNSALAKSMNNE